MKPLVLAVFLFVLAPSAAYGATGGLAARNVSGGVTRAPHRFELVGLHWRGSGSVSFRARSLSGRWSSWRNAAPEDDGPDARTREPLRRGWTLGSPFWVGTSDRIQVRTFGWVGRVRAHFVRSRTERRPLRAVAVAGSPLILSRPSWRADERIRRSKPVYADAVRFAVVHHTAGTNAYTRAQSAAIVRGIQRYHVLANGWHDIGYNFLVDKYGQIFEGRYGGVDRNVVGAHAQGFNQGSVGVALIGNYDATNATPAARAALTRLLAWRLDLAHVDPMALVSWRSTGNPKFPAGRMLTLRTISGHRDTGFTACPGSNLYRLLPSLTLDVAGTGLPKLYYPTVTGAPGGLVRFTGTLTEPLPWSVIVSQRNGSVIAEGSGEGTQVDWTWDARTIPAGKYVYAIDAGPTARPATGVVAGATSLSMLTALATPALITPNGDGRSDSTRVRYRLREPSLVTATLVDAVGVPVMPLILEQKNAGSYEFRWDAAGIPDGRYGIVITARNAIGIETTATLAMIVDRTLAAYRVVPQVFSPNGDGRFDLTRFRFTLHGPARVVLTVRRGKKTLGQVFSGPLEAGPHAIEWNGRFRSGVGQHEFSADIRATSTVTTIRQSVVLATDTTGPRLRFVSRPNLRFSVNEPSDITVVFDGTRTVTKRRLKPGAFTIQPGGPYSTLRAVARDFAGNDGRPLTSP
jgi:flagellar hook assembly protein FlgD